MPKPPEVPKIELMLITEPCPDAFSASAHVFMPRKTPVWSIAIVRSQSARRRLLDRRQVAQAGVVDEDVEPAALGEHALDGSLPAGLVGHVEVHVERVAAGVADRRRRLLARLVLHVRHHDRAPSSASRSRSRARSRSPRP